MRKIKHYNMYIVIFLMIAICISNMFAVYGGNDEPSIWAIDEVNQAIEIGIVPRSFTWDYQGNTTREEFCTMAVYAMSYIYGCRIESLISLKGITLKEPFSDAPFLNVTHAHTLGIVNGVGGNKFLPNSKITREEAATMINNIVALCNYTPPNTRMEFSDAAFISNYAVAGVQTCASMGVMKGSGGKFNSKDSYTHEQSIISIYRLCVLLKNEREKSLFSKEELSKINEIREKLSNIGPNTISEYSETPNTTPPYSIGKLREQFLNDGLDYVNFARYMVGLPNVSLSDDLNIKAQHGAFVLKATNQFTHYPENTTNLPEELFSIGADACSRCNLGSGYRSLYEFNRHCMDDSDPPNIANIGHRRWLLCPNMEYIGMGYVNSKSTTFVLNPTGDFYKSKDDFTQWDTINWPSAGLFPKSEFAPYTAWSVSLCDNYTADDNIEVKIVRQSDGKTWILSEESVKSSSGYFNFSVTGYGDSGPCIIFRPVVAEYIPGEIYTVTITGLYSNKLSKPHTLEYSVKFF